MLIIELSALPNLTLQTCYTRSHNVPFPFLCIKGILQVTHIELHLLTERTPKEWLPTHHKSYAKCISEFESWLSEQPEDVADCHHWTFAIF